jgi:methylphosphotriester-DNA--protein-cysteine methyltransferase
MTQYESRCESAVCNQRSRYGLADATVSRGFQKVFGVTPSAYRVRQRARAALQLAVAGDVALSEVAVRRDSKVSVSEDRDWSTSQLSQNDDPQDDGGNLC